MFKLCKWLYQLGYDRGYDQAKRDENNRRKLDVAVKKMRKEAII